MEFGWATYQTGVCQAYIFPRRDGDDYRLDVHCMPNPVDEQLPTEGWQSWVDLTLKREAGKNFSVAPVSGQAPFTARYEDTWLRSSDIFHFTGSDLPGGALRFDALNGHDAEIALGLEALVGHQRNGRRYRFEASTSGVGSRARELAPCALTVRRSRFSLGTIDAETDCPELPNAPMERARAYTGAGLTYRFEIPAPTDVNPHHFRGIDITVTSLVAPGVRIQPVLTEGGDLIRYGTAVD